MKNKRDIKIAVNFVSYKDAEHNDNLYFANLSEEALLKECFDLRRLNFFNGKKNNLPRIEKVGIMINKKDYEKQNA